MRRAPLAAALVAGLLGCTVDAVPLAPNVPVATPASGGGASIALSVIDDRLTRGERPWVEQLSRSGWTAEIHGSSGSAAGAVFTALEGALRARGLEIAEPDKEASAALDVEILTLCRQRLGFSIRIVALLRATASHGDSKRVSLYRGEEWRTIALLDHADPVNAALSQALQRLLDDPRLLAMLAEENPPM